MSDETMQALLDARSDLWCAGRLAHSDDPTAVTARAEAARSAVDGIDGVTDDATFDTVSSVAIDITDGDTSRLDDGMLAIDSYAASVLGADYFGRYASAAFSDTPEAPVSLAAFASFNAGPRRDMAPVPGDDDGPDDGDYSIV